MREKQTILKRDAKGMQLVYSNCTITSLVQLHTRKRKNRNRKDRKTLSSNLYQTQRMGKHHKNGVSKQGKALLPM